MMLEENQKILLTGMSELVFYLKRDMEELKSINESLKKKIAIKDDVMKFQLEQIEKLIIEKNELKKYRKEEKERKEFSKVLGETIKEMKTKEWEERNLRR